MNFKRHRPKNRRAGCLECKPWKANGVAKRAKSSELRRAEGARQQVDAVAGLPDKASRGHNRPSQRAVDGRAALREREACEARRSELIARTNPTTRRCGFLFVP